MDLPPHIGFQECKRIEGSNIGGASQLAGDERASILGFPRKDRYTLWMNPNIKHVMAVTFAPQVLTCMDLLKSFARFQGRESSASLLWKAGLSGFDESASRMWSETPHRSFVETKSPRCRKRPRTDFAECGARKSQIFSSCAAAFCTVTRRRKIRRRRAEARRWCFLFRK